MACRSRRICRRATSPLQTGDFTYMATAEGWLSPKDTSFLAYLTVAIDLFSRQVVGWSIHQHMRA
jgi:putative transposase